MVKWVLPPENLHASARGLVLKVLVYQESSDPRFSKGEPQNIYKYVSKQTSAMSSLLASFLCVSLSPSLSLHRAAHHSKCLTWLSHPPLPPSYLIYLSRFAVTNPQPEQVFLRAPR